jgi:hypothetical protein
MVAAGDADDEYYSGQVSRVSVDGFRHCGTDGGH